ncbi:MAG: YqzL family protein [Firmicutes bacterium]|nr:YqzL family protein [Bacillota bacterium]MDY5042072.1 YqzL family protein [Eubacteriales bacterium]
MDDMIDTCWKLFNETGEINYYLLYRALKEDK